MQASGPPARLLAAASSRRRRTRLSFATVAVAASLATAGCGDQSYCDSERHLRVKLKPDDAPLYVLVEEDDQIKPKCEVEVHNRVTMSKTGSGEAVVRELKVTCPEPFPFEQIYTRSPGTLVPVHAGGGYALTTDQCENHIGQGPRPVAALMPEFIEEGGSLGPAMKQAKAAKAAARPPHEHQT